MSASSCTKVVSHSIVKVEEHKRKIAFRNQNRDLFDVSRVDGCLVTAGQRCDFLVSKQKSTSILVELKGTDVAHACDQLFTSAKHAKVKPLLESTIGFVVVCSRYPRFDSFVAKAKQQAAKQYNAGFHVITKEGEFEIERVAAIDGPL